MGHRSGTKKEPKPKLLSPDIFRLGRGLPRQRVGAKKFDMSLETREIKLFWRDIPGFCRDIPAVPEKFEKNKFVFNVRSLIGSPYRSSVRLTGPSVPLTGLLFPYGTLFNCLIVSHGWTSFCGPATVQTP